MSEGLVLDDSSEGAPPTPGATRKRPLGITALALLSGSASVLILVAGVLLLATSAFSRDTLFMGMVMFLLFSGMYGVCAIGLWRLQNWARWALILVSAALGVRGFPLAAIVAIPVMIYLVKPETARAFRVSSLVSTEDAS